MSYPREDIYQRELALLGADALARLAESRVAVFGVGGVGSYAVEALARSGVGHLLLVDFDTVAVSNINRQLCALHSTVGMAKVDVMAARIADIDPACQVTVVKDFIDENTNLDVLLSGVDYLIDAIDHVPAKISLICYAVQHQLPVISAMGAGRRLDPAKLAVADISQTYGCPLARNIRKNLREKGISSGVKVIFSSEQAMPVEPGQLGSIAFVPSVAGLLMASEAVKDLAGLGKKEKQV